MKTLIRIVSFVFALWTACISFTLIALTFSLQISHTHGIDESQNMVYLITVGIFVVTRILFVIKELSLTRFNPKVYGEFGIVEIFSWFCLASCGSISGVCILVIIASMVELTLPSLLLDEQL